MKFSTHGAAQVVTGSCHQVWTGKISFLVDCGMFQGSKELNKLNYDNFAFDPEELDFMILTHSHIDHCGLIPKLVKNGFKGPIYCSPATADLLPIMLADAAFIQEKDTEYENERRKKEGLEPREPLYTVEEAEAVNPLIQSIKYNERKKLADGIETVLRDAGHVLGSAIAEVFITENGKNTKFIFSGDLGQWNVPIIEDPTLVSEGDYVFIESTYGTTIREKISDRKKELFDYIKTTIGRGGKVLIPCFALERTQEIIYTIGELIMKYADFPKVPIYIDSPLAIKLTEVFRDHPETYDAEARSMTRNPFVFPGLKFAQTKEESMEITKSDAPCIVLAGSGMCNAGRIRHHIRNGIEKPANLVLFVGYQAPGTLGRVLLDGALRIRMMGLQFDVKAQIAKMSAFSAHADQRELTQWLEAFTIKPKKVVLVHGEPEVMEVFSRHLEAKGFSTQINEKDKVYSIG